MARKRRWNICSPNSNAASTDPALHELCTNSMQGLGIWWINYALLNRFVARILHYCWLSLHRRQKTVSIYPANSTSGAPAENHYVSLSVVSAGMLRWVQEVPDCTSDCCALGATSPFEIILYTATMSLCRGSSVFTSSYTSLARRKPIEWLIDWW